MEERVTKTRNIREKTEIQIQPEGSLGLLALGHVGLRIWRQVRDTQKKTNEQA